MHDIYAFMGMEGWPDWAVALRNLAFIVVFGFWFLKKRRA